MLVIGLCGGSGSGKSTVCEAFSDCGIPSVDADRVYHDLTDRPSVCLKELTDTFGREILTESGVLNRKALARIVFAEGAEEKLKKLNEISHRHVLQKIREQISSFGQAGAPAVLIDAPLLFESGFDAECDVIVAVVADREIRIARIMTRDGLSRDGAISRIDHQLSDDFLRSRANYILENNAGTAELQASVLRLKKEIITQSTSS